MNCFDCKIPCEYSNPLGYCYKEQSGLPHGPFEKGYQPADAMKALDEKIKKVSEKGTWDGVDVDKYIAELRGCDTEPQQASKALADAVDGLVDAIDRLKSVLLDLKKIKENKND